MWKIVIIFDALDIGAPLVNLEEPAHHPPSLPGQTPP